MHIFVKPKSGMLVRHENPALGHIPAEGKTVDSTTYYRKRIKDGDLLIGSVPKAAKEKAA